MKNNSKVFIVFTLVLVLSLSSPISLIVSAQIPSVDAYNTSVREHAQTIATEYFVKIVYSFRKDGYSSIGTSSLATLETSLSFLSRDFVRELSKYYYNTYGNYLTFEFAYIPDNEEEIDSTVLGFFSSENSVIKIYVPTVKSQVTVSGCGPLTIIHEIGHAYNLYLSNTSDYEKNLKHWSEMNANYNYSSSYNSNPDRYTFVSTYASRNYEEDFAETFAYAFTSNRPGLGLGDRMYKKDGQPTALGRKINYIESSILTFLVNPYDAQRNLNRTRSTPSITKYNDVCLSGNSLEYIGFNPPNGVFEHILEKLKIKSSHAEWIWEVGGWKVWDNAGGIYLIFPGAEYVTLRFPDKKIAA